MTESKTPSANGGGPEPELSPKAYALLGELGLRLPTTPSEVRSAAEWAAAHPQPLSPKLLQLPTIDPASLTPTLKNDQQQRLDGPQQLPR